METATPRMEVGLKPPFIHPFNPALAVEIYADNSREFSGNKTPPLRLKTEIPVFYIPGSGKGFLERLPSDAWTLGGSTARNHRQALT